MNLLSHVTLALAISECLSLNILWVVMGSLIPDIDYLIGVTHRTIMHSLLFTAIIGFAAVKYDKRKGTSLIIGLLSHLLLDVLTIQGVMLLWPVQNFYSYSLFPSLNDTMNLLIVIISIILLWNKDIIIDKLKNLGHKKVQILTYSLLLIPLIGTIPYYHYNINYECENISLNELLNNQGVYNEACVTINGIVCSQVSDYTSNAGNDYLIFNVCSEEESLIVWLLKPVYSIVEVNNSLTLTGLFTTKFEEPELYMIKSVRKN